MDIFGTLIDGNAMIFSPGRYEIVLQYYLTHLFDKL